MADPQQDWFAANAPQQQTQGDWFAQNAPSQQQLPPQAPSIGQQIISGAKNLGSDLAGMVAGIPMGPPNPGAFINQAAQLGNDVAARKMEGRSPAYNTVATVGQLAGINSRGMEESANEGNTGGVIGHALAVPTAVAIGHGIAKGAPAAADAMRNKFYEASTAAARATIPEARQLPPQAVFGAEKVYRAAAPVGSDPQFRANVYKAAGDLAEVGQKAQIAESKGGVIQPDMRVRATVNAINDHLTEMYQNERAPQIQRNAQNPVQVKLNPDAEDGLTFLSRRAGSTADRSLAENALDSQFMPLAQIDQLAKLVNKELLGYESMTPAERAASAATNRRVAGLKALDQQLSEMIGKELQSRGEAGIGNYEQRYAALSQIRDQLQSRMNATELQRSNAASRGIKMVTGGVKGIASASQAAVADVNIGQQLQDGLASLAKSGIRANRGVPGTTVPVRGLLGPGPIQLPSSLDPTGELSAMPSVAQTTRAQRLNLLLPEKAGGRIPLGASSIPVTPTAPPIVNALTRAQRLRLLLPERTGGPFVQPPSGALDDNPFHR